MGLNILVYNGPGTAPSHARDTLRVLQTFLSQSYDISFVDHDTLQRGQWPASTALLVVPGGQDVPYVRDLPADLIRAYVRDGGRYWGICAGAYYAAAEIVFEPDRPEYAVCGPRPLGFCGRAVGSVTPEFTYGTEASARIKELVLGSELAAAVPGDAPPPSLPVYVNGGPFLELADPAAHPDVTSQRVLAHYDTVAVAVASGSDPQLQASTTYPAIVRAQYGRGEVLLTSPHLETAPETVPNPADAAQWPRFQQTQPARDAVLGCLLRGLGLAINEPETDPIDRAQGSRLYLCTEPELESTLRPFHRPAPPSSAAPAVAIVWPLEPPSARGDAAVPEALPATLAAELFARPSEYPTKTSLTARFDVKQCYTHWARRRIAHPDSQRMQWPFALLYSEVVTSTQTVLEASPALLAAVPSGFAYVAEHQTQGRGRASNTWLSQKGCLQFSISVKLPHGLPVVNLQYLVALSIVDGITALLPYEKGSRVRLKWPNDIYVRAATDRDGAPHYEKVGGILVQTSTLGDHFHVISGIGLNVTNKRPTATLADVDPAVTQEKLLAEILLHLDRNMAIFARDRSFGFFRPQYERVWLHQHQDVSYRVPVPNGPDRIAQGRITGIDEQGHLLLDVGGNRISVMPDGNRFDFLRGLIYPA